MKFYNQYDKKPPKVHTQLDNETCFVSQSEVKTSSLAYQLQRYGMDSLQARLEQMRDKFGYADCVGVGDFSEIQNRYRRSVEYFEALPSEVRRKYADRPENFYSDVENNPKVAYEHGFIDEQTFKKLVPEMPIQQKGNTVDLNDSVVSSIVKEDVKEVQNSSGE